MENGLTRSVISEAVQGILAGVEAAVAGADFAVVFILLADFVLEAAAGHIVVEAFKGFDGVGCHSSVSLDFMYFAVAGEAWMIVRVSMRTVRILRERRCSASLAFSRSSRALERCSMLFSAKVAIVFCVVVDGPDQSR